MTLTGLCYRGDWLSTWLRGCPPSDMLSTVDLRYPEALFAEEPDEAIFVGWVYTGPGRGIQGIGWVLASQGRFCDPHEV